MYTDYVYNRIGAFFIMDLKNKIVAFALSLALMSGLTGCGDSAENPVESTTPPKQGVKTETSVDIKRMAEIDISRDNTKNMPSAEAVISGGTTQEMVSSFEGDYANAALTVNGEPISSGIVQFAINDGALTYAQSLMLLGVMSEPNSFDWNAKDPNYDGTYFDYVKYNALEDLIPRFALVAEGKRRGITLTEDDRKAVQNWLTQQQGTYSDVAFTGLLNQNGCPSIDAYIGFRELAVLEEKVVKDFENNPEKYATMEQLMNADERDLITVKHILVAFNDDDVMGEASDEMKAAAKKEAEEVLAKVNAGGDFESLMREHSDDLASGNERYTFEKDDGKMIKQFEDASLKLDIGQTSGLVEVEYGYHIIKRYANVTDYMILLNKNAKVVLNNSVFGQMKVTADIELYLNSVKQTLAQAQQQR